MLRTPVTNEQVDGTPGEPGRRSVRKSELSDRINSAFVTAYLITGNSAVSLQSVEEAISNSDDLLKGPDLFAKTAHAALKSGCQHRNDCRLPPELERVMALPQIARRCLVLRCLAGLSALTVSELLQLNPAEVSRYTADGMKRLAKGLAG